MYRLQTLKINYMDTVPGLYRFATMFSRTFCDPKKQNCRLFQKQVLSFPTKMINLQFGKAKLTDKIS